MILQFYTYICHILWTCFSFSMMMLFCIGIYLLDLGQDMQANVHTFPLHSSDTIFFGGVVVVVCFFLYVTAMDILEVAFLNEVLALNTQRSTWLYCLSAWSKGMLQPSTFFFFFFYKFKDTYSFYQVLRCFSISIFSQLLYLLSGCKFCHLKI